MLQKKAPLSISCSVIWKTTTLTLVIPAVIHITILSISSKTNSTQLYYHMSKRKHWETLFFLFHSEILRKPRQLFSFLTRSLCADSGCTECRVKPNLIGPSSLFVPSHFHKHYLFTSDSSCYILFLWQALLGEGGMFQLKLFMPACLDILKMRVILKVNRQFPRPAHTGW